MNVDSSLIERRKMIVDDTLYEYLKSLFGLQTACGLIVFFETWRQYGETMAIAQFSERTSYYYRNLLVQAGLLKRPNYSTVVVADEYKLSL